MNEESSASSISREEMIATARDMVPALRGRAAQADADRGIPEATHREFLDAGLYRIHQPTRYGGFAWDPSMMVNIAAELGRACGSSAWVFSNLAVQSWIVGMHNPEAQEDLWGDNPLALVASSFSTQGGTARKVDGGFVVDGLWSFSSGVDFADWDHLQIFIPREDGPPEHRFALVPKSDYEIVDDWYSSGLAGTGSRSLRLDEVFVPEHRTLQSTLVLGGPSPGSAVDPAPLYRAPPLTLGTKVFTGPALGIARGALEAVEAEMRDRRSVGGVPMVELPTVHIRVAEAGAEIEAAWALLLKDCADAMRIAESGAAPDLDQRARWRVNNAFAAQLCLRAVERLHPLAGARGLAPDTPFQRAWRDIHAAVLQITTSWDVQRTNAGRIRFGLPSLDPRV